MSLSFIASLYDLDPSPHKVTWENLMALQNAFKDMDITVEYREDHQAFRLRVSQTDSMVSSDALWSAAMVAMTTATKMKALKDKATKAKVMSWCPCSILPATETKLTAGLCSVIRGKVQMHKRMSIAKDWSAAWSYAQDVDALFKIVNEIDKGHKKRAERLVCQLDTAVRDYVPQAVWDWFNN
jgi:hypothetical protein